MKAEERWLRQHRKLARPWLDVSALLAWAATLVLGLQAWLLATVITAVSFQQASLSEQWCSLVAMLALLPLRALFAWGAEQAAHRGAIQVKTQLRARLFTRLRHRGPAGLAQQEQGALLTLLSDGIEALGGYYARYLPATLQLIATPVTLLLFIAPRDWLSALILIATAPLVPVFMILIGKGAERRNQRQWRQLTRMGAHFLDMIRGLPTLKLFNASQREAGTVAQAADEYRRRTLSVLRIAFLSSFTLEFFATVSIAVVAVVIGFRLYWGEMAFMEGFFVLLLAPEFYLPLRNLGTRYHDRMDALGAAEQLMPFFQQPSQQATSGDQPFQPRQKKGIRLEFRNLSFHWPGQAGGVRDLNLALEPGERIAIVGPSGAGKSTLMKLLLAFIQADQGELFADGQPLSRMAAASWRRHLAWVPQSPHLFHASVADNIALGATDASRERIVEAARAAHCLEFIEALPQGMNTLIGEGGAGLSGGQRQRVALARAFLRQAPLVLLDEPSANLDLASERLIQQSVDELARQSTLIVVAHRLHTVRNADRILVMDEGKIVQQGTHESLAEAPGLYARLLGAHLRGAA